MKDLDLKKAMSCLPHDEVVSQMREKFSPEKLENARTLLGNKRDNLLETRKELAAAGKWTEDQQLKLDLLNKKLAQISSALLPTNPQDVAGVKATGSTEYSLPAEGLAGREQRERELVSRKTWTVELPDGNNLKVVAETPKEAHALAHAQHEYLKHHAGEASEDAPKGKKSTSAQKTAAEENRKARLEASKTLAKTQKSPVAHKVGTSKGNDVFAIIDANGQIVADKVEVPRSAGHVNERKAEAIKRGLARGEGVSELESAWSHLSASSVPKKGDAYKGGGGFLDDEELARRISSEAKRHAQLAGRFSGQSWDHQKARDSEGNGWGAHSMSPAEYRKAVRMYYNQVSGGKSPKETISASYDKKLKSIRTQLRRKKISSAEYNDQKSTILDAKNKALKDFNDKTSARRLDSEHRQLVTDALSSGNEDKIREVNPSSVTYHDLSPKEMSDIRAKIQNLGSVSASEKVSSQVANDYFTKLKDIIIGGKSPDEVEPWTSSKSDWLRREHADAVSTKDKDAASKISEELKSKKHSLSLGSPPEIPQIVFEDESKKDIMNRAAGVAEKNRNIRNVQTFINNKIKHEIDNDFESELAGKWRAVQKTLLKKYKGLEIDEQGKFKVDKDGKPLGTKEDREAFNKEKNKFIANAAASELGQAGSLKRDRAFAAMWTHNSAKKDAVSALTESGKSSAAKKLQKMPYSPEHFPAKDRLDAIMQATGGYTQSSGAEEQKVDGEPVYASRARGQTGAQRKNLRALLDWGRELKSHLSQERNDVFRKEGIPQSGRDLTPAQKKFVSTFEKEHDKFISDLISHLKENSDTYGEINEDTKDEFASILKKSADMVFTVNTKDIFPGVFLGINLFKGLPLSEEQKIRAFRNSFGRANDGVNPASMNTDPTKEYEKDDEDDKDDVKKGLNLGFYVRC